MDKTLAILSRYPELRKNCKFAQILVAEMHNYYIDNVKIPENEIIKIIGKSKLDNNITLMPNQLIFLKKIEKNDKVVISAPTSFGKTFLVLEHIKRFKSNYNSIVYIVHTKSLKDELYQKFNRFFSGEFEILDNIEEISDNQKYILILVSDGQNIYNFEKQIDLLVVDEAYNLSKTQSNERYFCIMRAYIDLLLNSNKVILLGPFIKNIRGNYIDDFILHQTEYSPVSMNIIEGNRLDNLNPKQLFLTKIDINEKTICYFGSKNNIYSFMNEMVENDYKEVYTDAYIEWMENNYPSFWLLPKLMKMGIGLYHSAFPKHINMYNMNKFNNENFTGLLTTSAVLEGVNTSSKNLIIFKTNAGEKQLTPFQFFNLCGRVGRLGKEIIGIVYNFGDTYLDMYENRKMDLYIGNEELTDNYDKFDDGEDNEVVEKEIRELLANIGIDFDKWYNENIFYSRGSRNLVNILKQYYEYRDKLKKDINNKTLLNKSGEKINKNKILEHFYNNFIKEVDGACYRPTSQFSAVYVMKVLLQSKYEGVNFILKDVCNNSSIKSNLDKLDIIDKNKYLLEIMKLGYNYIPNIFYNYIYLFNEFMNSDSFWTQEYKQLIFESLYKRVLVYLNNDDSKYSKTKKKLTELGFVPSIINKIIDIFKEDNYESDLLNKRSIINKIIKIETKLQLSKSEKINYKIIID